MRNFPVLGLLFLGTSVLAATPPAPLETISLSGVSGAKDTPAQAFSHARYNLLSGTQYARAVRQLEFCTARAPKNSEYHLALGCAEADRAASVAYAAMWTQERDEERDKYPQAVKDWQAAQRDPKSDNYGSPRPTPPPDKSFPTKDDGKAFTLTPAQAAALVGHLSQSAQTEWKQALALSSTPAQRADAEWVQGCGLRLLRLAQPKNGPTQADVVNALTAATHDAPQNAVYWQSLGDALRGTDILTQILTQAINDDKNNAPTVAAYQKSLALQPKNTPLWFRVYHMQAKSGRDPQPDAEAAMRHAMDSDPGNAYPHYLLAALLLRRTHFSDPSDMTEPADKEKSLTATYDDAQYKDADAALSEMEAGNAAPRYAVPEYVSPAPELLTAFAFWQSTLRAADLGFGEMARLRELARAASGYGRICAAHGDKAGLERGTRATIGMGMKMAGDWPIKDRVPDNGDILHSLVGFAVTSIGYSSLVKGYAALGDDGASQAAQAEWDAFKARQALWKQAYDAATHPDSIYDAY